MSSRIKAKVNLEPGDAYVVLSQERWDHIISTYRTLAERLDTEDAKQAWRDLADEVEWWVAGTLNSDNESIEDEWS